VQIEQVICGARRSVPQRFQVACDLIFHDSVAGGALRPGVPRAVQLPQSEFAPPLANSEQELMTKA